MPTPNFRCNSVGRGVSALVISTAVALTCQIAAVAKADVTDPQAPPATLSGPVLSSPADKPPAHPVFPRFFDETEVRLLITNIDKPHNASFLKVGYFVRHDNPDLPVGDGYALLQTAAKAAPLGTARWFWLQNVLGFASFRCAAADPQDGFQSYEKLFDAAGQASTRSSRNAVRSAINEYVASVPGKLKGMGLGAQANTRTILVKAWLAALTVSVAEAGRTNSRAPQPPWEAAFTVSGAGPQVLPLVEQELQDPKLSRSFAFLTVAAELLAPSDPQRALTLYAEAKPLLPRDNRQLILNPAGRWTLGYVDLLVAQNRLVDAIKEQSEFVTATGHGQGRLLLLQYKAGHQDAVQAILLELQSPQSDGREVVQAAAGLFGLADTTKAPDALAGSQAVSLLQSFLAPGRIRPFDEEAQARLRLAEHFLFARDWKNAGEALSYTAPPAPVPPRYQTLMNTMERVKAEAAKLHPS